MFGWAGRLKAFFVLPDREYLLLCPQLGEGWGLLHLVRGEKDEPFGGWLLQACIQEAPLLLCKIPGIRGQWSLIIA